MTEKKRNTVLVPKVSICVPNLNTRPFLPERFETIFNQSYQDWELLVYDSYSNDGAWEYIGQLAASEPRMCIWQGPREGTPGSWTPCVREAVGEYIYIATSDDTMPPDCLEKLVAALEAHPECDVAHCTLKAIDEHGRETPFSDWWLGGSTFAHSSGELLHRPHVRRAPFDGLLHLLGGSVYISITQLLIRRSLFERIGLFKSQWGSVGDFNWNMRAGLVANTVHVPDTWGGWRIHSNQATADAALGSAEHAGKIQSMIKDAISSCEQFLAQPLLQPLAKTRELAAFLTDLTRRSNSLQRKAFFARRLLTGSLIAREFLKLKLPGQAPGSPPDLVRSWLEDAGLGPILVPV